MYVYTHTHTHTIVYTTTSTLYTTTNYIGGVVDKKKSLYTAGVNVNWYSHYGKRVWSFLKKLRMSYHMTQQSLLLVST